MDPDSIQCREDILEFDCHPGTINTPGSMTIFSKDVAGAYWMIGIFTV